jgi:hypothetical protein
VVDIKNLSSFNLRKEGVQVEVVEWIRDLDHFSVLTEVWVQMEGIPPKWCDWVVFAQMTSGFGLLREVDRASLFKSFYENVRVKISCRNPTKIPRERLFELSEKLYMINFLVEGFEQRQGSDDGGDHDGDDKGEEFDDCDDLDDFSENMETDKTAKKGGNMTAPHQTKSGCGGVKTVPMGCEGGGLQSESAIAYLYSERDMGEKLLADDMGMPGAYTTQYLDDKFVNMPVSELCAGTDLVSGGCEAGFQDGDDVINMHSGDGDVEKMIMDDMASDVNSLDQLTEPELSGQDVQGVYGSGQKEIIKAGNKPLGQQGSYQSMGMHHIDMEAEDSEQKSKWQELLESGLGEYCVDGLNLLRKLDQVDDDLGETDNEEEEQDVLDEVVVTKFAKTRDEFHSLKQCDKGKSKGSKWGLVLVERQRRSQNCGETMLQEAMRIKKKKNLEPLKGNSFAPLQSDELNALAMDINIKVGRNDSENSNILNKMVSSEIIKSDRFAGQNPEVLLPTDLDIDLICDNIGHVLLNESDHLTSINVVKELIGVSPPCSIKEPNSSELWTDVVRKGRRKGKNRIRNDKMVNHERRILEC